MGSTDLVDKEWIETIFKSYQDSKQIKKITSATSTAATNAGDNYTSLMLRTRISSILGSGETVSKNVIVKKKLPSNEVAVLLNKAFLREANVYKRILNKYSQMMIGTPLAGEEMWPKCYFGSAETVVMEDIKVLGYKLADRKSGLDLQHSLLAIKSLSRLHGLSVVAIDRGLVNTNLLGLFGFLDGNCTEFFNTTITGLSNAIMNCWGSEWRYLSDKMKAFKEVFLERLSEKYYEECPLKVICHGDCWVNNQMYKYDRDGNPTNVKFVDFQVAHYNSYAWDLNYLIGTSIRHQVRDPNYELLLQTYRDGMDETFRILGSKREAPTLEDIGKECHRVRIFEFLVHTLTVPISICEPDEVIELDDFFNNPSKAERLYTKPEYVERMKVYIQKHIDDGTV